MRLIRFSGGNSITFFFGPSTVPEDDRWRQRIGLLSAEERQRMEGVVSHKLKQMQGRALAWEPEEVYADGGR